MNTLRKGSRRRPALASAGILQALPVTASTRSTLSQEDIMPKVAKTNVESVENIEPTNTEAAPIKPVESTGIPKPEKLQ
jgi:hypothetical protein